MSAIPDLRQNILSEIEILSELLSNLKQIDGRIVDMEMYQLITGKLKPLLEKL